uniref:Retinol dehydrogenase 14 n=3 Tax=Lygus hesperus TaxID=30085 RepID=A0A0K8T4Q4_LYGHE
MFWSTLLHLSPLLGLVSAASDAAGSTYTDSTAVNFFIAISLFVVSFAVTAGALVLGAALVRNSAAPPTSARDMKGKTVVITGANSGIGYETALDIARRGARVVMACRNTEAAAKAREEIAEKTKNSNVVVKKLDLSSLKSVREFAAEINKNESRLDVLVHNAGMANTFEKKVTEDGLEITMATNMYGPFLLTHLLIDLLKKSKPSRIVIVASDLYKLANLDLENPNPINSLPAYLYYVSKRANITWARELSRRLEGSGVTANFLHPGMIDSGIWRNVPFPLNLPLKVIVKVFFKTPEKGAQTTVHLAVSDELDDVNGKYFMDCREHSLTNSVQDVGREKRFWEICETMVKLTPSDPRI